MITKDIIIQIDSEAKHSKLDLDGIAAKLSLAFTDANNGFSSISRQACFIGQLCEESAHFCKLIENLNYSANGLLATFPKHFNPSEAAAYAHQPQKIANRVYANRMGNGDEASGDGWKYRGRGLLEITGKDNYTQCGLALCQDLITNPDLLVTSYGAVNSAVWYYTVFKNLNHYADTNDVLSITKAINGGTLGLAARIDFTYKAHLMLQQNQ